MLFEIKRSKTHDKGKKLQGLKKYNKGHGSKHNRKPIYEARGKENVNHNTMRSNEQKESKEGITKLLSSFEESNYNLQRLLNLY